MWSEPIYNRRRADVDLIKLDPINENNIGSFNATDLNRIENNCLYMANTINALIQPPTPLNIKVKTDWVIETKIEDVHITEIERIRNNIELLETYVNSQDYRNIIHDGYMDYNKANALEFNLHLMKDLIDKLSLIKYKCGTYYCGLKPLFGKGV